MARLRYNNSLGTLGGSLTDSGTTITFAVAPAWATLSGSDYIPLTLDPPTDLPNADFEIVYVTAYTATDTTATISRGQEGTSGVAHTSGATWLCGPVVDDFEVIGPSAFQSVVILDTAPTAGQVLIASDATDASWEDNDTIDGVTVSGSPSSGQVLTATSSSAADWQTPTVYVPLTSTSGNGFADASSTGIQITENAATGGIRITNVGTGTGGRGIVITNEDASNPIELQDTGGQGIYLDSSGGGEISAASTGGIGLDDNSSGGVVVREDGGGGLFIKDNGGGGLTIYEGTGTGGINMTDAGTGSDTIILPNLPTADPHVVGQLWNNIGILTVSAG